MDSTTATEHYDPRLVLLNKKELIDIIIAKKNEIVSLNEDFNTMTNLRLYYLERNHYMHLQYGRRDSVEIVGIPQDVKVGISSHVTNLHFRVHH